MIISNDYALIGYACDLAGGKTGAKNGLKVLRKKNLLQIIEQLGHNVVDFGDCNGDLFESENIAFSKSEEQMLNPLPVFRACKHLYTKTSEALAINKIPIIIGGDHSGSIASFSAVSDYYQKMGKKIGLIYIDAHPDCHDFDTSITKRIYGTTIGVLSGKTEGAFNSLQKYSPSLDLKNLAYIGLRDVDAPEKDFIAKNKISASSIKEVDRYGIASCIDKAIEVASKNTDGFFVSFDIDVCEPKIVPGTQIPIPGGLNFREGRFLVESIYSSGKMCGFELSEFNPELDKGDITADLCIGLLESVCGKSIL